MTRISSVLDQSCTQKVYKKSGSIYWFAKDIKEKEKTCLLTFQTGAVHSQSFFLITWLVYK